jgi:predicted DsbA family dithiol-disulfide isomerase
MARILIPIFFDYASTLCYVAWRIVRELEPELGFEALWKGVPIRLRDGRSRPGNPLGPIERMKVMTVVAETGIAVAPPERWIDSEQALMGSELARELDRFSPYHDAVFRAAFEERRDLADPETIAMLAERAGLAREVFRTALVSGRLAARLEENRREADQHSALGYPTFILGDFPLTGIQPIATMRLIIRRYLEQRAREPGN